MQDSNPSYTDEEYAKKSRYGSIVAPATMLLTWTMPPLWPPRQEPPHSLTMTGKVIKKCTEGDQHLLNVKYDFTVPRGRNCSGIGTIALPAGGYQLT